MRESLNQIFTDIEKDKLPSLPHVLLKFLDASYVETVPFDQLAELIKKDVALSAKIISIVSSGYYGGQGKDLTFEKVLVLLGMNTLKTLAITASVQQFFSCFEPSRTKHLKQFWHDSLTCALIAKSLAKLTGYSHGDEAYLTGLLHNIGELLFAGNFAVEFQQLCQSAKNHDDMLQIESEKFGGDRYQAGAWLISGWEPKSPMVDAVFYQNEPIEQLQDSHQLVKIICLANLCCNIEDDLSDTAFAAAEILFDLNHELIATIVSNAKLEVAAVAASMDINCDVTTQQQSNDISNKSALSVDELKQVELAGRVRNIALIDGVKQQFSLTLCEDDVFKSIKKGLHILFGVQHSFVFLFNKDQNKLLGHAVDPSDERIESFSVTVNNSQTLLSRCFVEKKPINSFCDQSTPISVLDRQLIKMAGNAGMYCLPLRTANNDIGVLVVGCDRPNNTRKVQMENLLAMFVAEAVKHLDIYHQQLQQEQERQLNEKSIYQLRAKEVVHEVNNPLTIIKNYVHILSTKLEGNDPIHDDIAIIQDELDRAGSILLRLPGIVDQPLVEGKNQFVNINQLILEVLHIFSASLFAAHNIELDYKPDDSMVLIECDTNALKQVLTNLIKNAVEALPDHGIVSITTQGLVNYNGKSFIGITIGDNGPGIDQKVQSMLFTPIETNKGSGHAGLGLAIVKNLVGGMDGSISCRSDYKGTLFEILLPRRTEE